MTLERLKEVFPHRERYPGEIDGGAPEVFDYQRDFYSRPWLEIEDDVIDYHDDVFSFMAEEALRFYFPCYLKRAIADPSSPAATAFLSFFCSDRSVSVFSVFTRAQKLLCAEVAATSYEATKQDWTIGCERLMATVEKIRNETA